MESEMRDIENVVIIGSGPAGYTAALYVAGGPGAPRDRRASPGAVCFQLTTDVENYPGYPQGVLGPAMMQEFRDQAERFGTRFVTDDATKVELGSEPGALHRIWVGDREIRTRSVILAMGAEPRKLGVPGEDELAARGVSYCATCDAAFYRDTETMVVGGGDTAMEDALFLSKFAGKVTIVHRRDEFRASAIMVDRMRETDNIEPLTPYVVERFEAGANGALGRAVLTNTEDASTKELPVTGAFIAIGHRPNSQLVAGQLELDELGYVEVEPRSTRTRCPGSSPPATSPTTSTGRLSPPRGPAAWPRSTPRPTCAIPAPTPKPIGRPRRPPRESDRLAAAVGATLYAIPGSHAVRTAELMLQHKGIEFRRVEFPPAPTGGLVRLRGFRGDRVPALKLDGAARRATRPIARALDELRRSPPGSRRTRDGRPSAGARRSSSPGRDGYSQPPACATSTRSIAGGPVAGSARCSRDATASAG